MKSTLLALTALLSLSTASFAADAVAYEPAPVAEATPVAFTWNGFYAGAFGGLTAGDYEFEAGPTGGASVLDLDVSGNGAFAGGQVGYDWQFNQFVIGAVADIAWANHEADISANLAGVTASASSELNYLGTVRARVGYAAFERALIYAHGGYAYGETEQNISVDGVSVFDNSKRKDGWVVGGGLEFAVTDNLSVQTEYSYVDLGQDTIFSDFGADVSEDLKFHAIKAAVNFRF